MTRTDIINSLVKKFHYQSYLEIGTQNGKNYEQINCEDKTGVDPDPKIMFSGVVKMTSDEFFDQNKRGFDIIFVDGLHYADQVYRDIRNSLRFLNKGGTIVCHDMNPTNKEMQEVPRKVKQWTGDCWKAWVRMKYMFNNIDHMVVDTDFGVGIIQPTYFYKAVGSKIILENLSYEYLDKNRKELLNLITVQGFKNWLGC